MKPKQRILACLMLAILTACAVVPAGAKAESTVANIEGYAFPAYWKKGGFTMESVMQNRLKLAAVAVGVLDDCIEAKELDGFDVTAVKSAYVARSENEESVLLFFFFTEDIVWAAFADMESGNLRVVKVPVEGAADSAEEILLEMHSQGIFDSYAEITHEDIINAEKKLNEMLSR